MDRLSIQAPWVNHLLFADGRLIFLNPQAQSADRLNYILRYVDCSGQAVNREKSSIYFNANTQQPTREALKQSLEIHVEAFPERYLGLPTAIGKITSGMFDHIVDRCRSKMHGYSEWSMACAAQEVLLKIVVQAIPTFSMSYFLLTKKVCKSIISCMAKYW